MGNLNTTFKPSTKEKLLDAIYLYCKNERLGKNKYGIVGDWDVSLITDMSNLFCAISNFDQDISNWDVSNVTNMKNMFALCKKFNQPLNNWNVSNVTDMTGMFFECNNFNQPLNNWNVSNVINMTDMFNNCVKFNQPLNNWNVSNVVKMTRMFYMCKNLNQLLDKWNNNTYWIIHMFTSCNKYNKSLIMWHKLHDIPTNKSLIDKLDNLVENPYTSKQKNDIINNIMNTSLINYICDCHEKIMIIKYKNIFKGYIMPYKVVNYRILCVLEYLGIKMSDAIDYNRFNNELFINLIINKKNTIINNLIKYIKKNNIERYNCLSNDLIKLFNTQINKKVNILIYNNDILLS